MKITAAHHAVPQCLDVYASKQALLDQASKQERLAFERRRDLDTVAGRHDLTDPEPYRRSLESDIAVYAEWAARLRRFAEVW